MSSPDLLYKALSPFLFTSLKVPLLITIVSVIMFQHTNVDHIWTIALAKGLFLPGKTEMTSGTHWSRKPFPTNYYSTADTELSVETLRIHTQKVCYERRAKG